MASPNTSFVPFAERMQAEALPELAVKTFEHYYTQLVEGYTGLIPEESILPVDKLPDAQNFPRELEDVGQLALAKTVLLKLNGGLGTSMGLDRAKSLLIVRNNLTFLDIIARQALLAEIPLLLMNSFATRDDSVAVLKKYPDLWHNIPVEFFQHKVPKVRQDTLGPVAWPTDPNLEWCPPGHGDIYTALVTSGMLDSLLAAGYEYAFVSNADNLGAVVDLTILGFFVENKLPFMMEAAHRTEADKKGGHLARLPNGQLILRELAQCPREDLESFQDTGRHQYFNTNNLWVNLPSLKAVMADRNNILRLPMIRNAKTVDPRDSSTTPVYQLETAMGSAVAVFEGAGAIRVPRARFAPVKTTNDLLAVRSDAYILTDDFQVMSNPGRTLGQVVINLDPTYYKLVDDMEARFPHGVPSLIECKHLGIQGDIKFGRNISVKGRVKLANETNLQIRVEDGTVLEGG
jgi:UTP--glucose-1-phosphate uridylyltransferase